MMAANASANPGGPGTSTKSKSTPNTGAAARSSFNATSAGGMAETQRIATRAVLGNASLSNSSALGRQLRGKRGYAGDICPGPCKAGDKSELYRVAGVGHHDGDLGGRALRSFGCWGGRRQHHLDVEGNEFGGKFGIGA